MKKIIFFIIFFCLNIFFLIFIYIKYYKSDIKYYTYEDYTFSYDAKKWEIKKSVKGGNGGLGRLQLYSEKYKMTLSFILFDINSSYDIPVNSADSGISPKIPYTLKTYNENDLFEVKNLTLRGVKYYCTSDNFTDDKNCILVYKNEITGEYTQWEGNIFGHLGSIIEINLEDYKLSTAKRLQIASTMINEILEAE